MADLARLRPSTTLTIRAFAFLGCLPEPALINELRLARGADHRL